MKLLAWECLDSRGNPTVACEAQLAGGACGHATVPAGASTGRHEAVELRDGGPRYVGRGVAQAVRNVTEVLGPVVRGLDARDQRQVDKALLDADGTADLSRLGANAVLAVSIASALAAATAEGAEPYRWFGAGAEPLLPMPMINILSGGAHAGGAVDFQDFLVIPVGAQSFSQALEWAWRVRRATAEVLESHGMDASLVADEGGLGPRLESNRQALELLSAGIERSGVALGDDCAIAIDVAATQLCQPDGSYRLRTEGRDLAATELLHELEQWCKSYPVISLEDPLGEDDWKGWAEASARLGATTQLLGDDLFVTNNGRLERGIAAAVANAVLIKPNQNGTLSGALSVVQRARAAGYATILSARSGETEDAWLADLAVGWRTGQLKVGSLTRSERNAKWNRLLQIEAQSPGIEFAGRHMLAPLAAVQAAQSEVGRSWARAQPQHQAWDAGDPGPEL